MSTMREPESLQSLRTAEAGPLGAAEETARRRIAIVVDSIGKLEAYRLKQGILSPEELAANEARQARMVAAIHGVGVTADTHSQQVVDLALERVLREGRIAADVATGGADATVLRPQFGALGEEYRRAA